MRIKCRQAVEAAERVAHDGQAGLLRMRAECEQCSGALGNSFMESIFLVIEVRLPFHPMHLSVGASVFAILS